MPQMLYWTSRMKIKVTQKKDSIQGKEEDRERKVSKMIDFFCVNLFLGRGGGEGWDKDRQNQIKSRREDNGKKWREM